MHRISHSAFIDKASSAISAMLRSSTRLSRVSTRVGFSRDSLTGIIPQVNNDNIPRNDDNNKNNNLIENIEGCTSGEEDDIRRNNSIERTKLNMNILVVDDSSLNRKMLCRLIKDQVTSITEAVDGRKAVSYIKHHNLSSIDVILMDYVMPNMDGPTATREIRALGYNGLIIGLTGNVHEDEIDTFIHAGANRVLIKPLHVEDLFDVIEGNAESIHMETLIHLQPIRFFF